MNPSTLFRLGILASLVLVLAACKPAVTPGGTTPPPTAGAPTHASVAHAKGLFLAASTARGIRPKVSARSVAGRDIVTATDATLGAISSSGITETAEFADATGAAVTVTITQALELTPTYLLFTYSGDYSGLAVLNIASGAIAQVSALPDNWTTIFALGAQAYYISAGALVRLDLSTGTAAALSTSAEAWAVDGSLNLDQGMATSWPRDTWIYADLAGNCYAMEMMNSGSYHAVCVTASGVVQDFGANWRGSDFLGRVLNGHGLIDQSTNLCYYEAGGPAYTPDPQHPGSSLNTGYIQNLYAVTFDPSSPGIIGYTGTPLATVNVPNADVNVGFGLSLTYIGYGMFMQQSILSDGSNTYQVTPSGFTVYDTSAVPVSHLQKDGTTNLSYVGNWAYSGGAVYAGPTQAVDTVSLVKFGAGTVTNPTLLSDPGIVSWSVVGGVLFWTDALGTSQAAVNTATGTLGVASAYSGGQPVAVTQ